MVPSLLSRFRKIPLLAVVLAGVLLIILSGSAVMVFPEHAQVFDPSTRLVELNLAVHQRIVLATAPVAKTAQSPATTLKRGRGAALDLVLLLMAVTKRELGVEPRLALVRMGSGSERYVMEWRGLYFDPTLANCFPRREVDHVIRLVSYRSAFELSGR
jgi:hypothetical protein